MQVTPVLSVKVFAVCTLFIATTVQAPSVCPTPTVAKFVGFVTAGADAAIALNTKYPFEGVAVKLPEIVVPDRVNIIPVG